MNKFDTRKTTAGNTNQNVNVQLVPSGSSAKHKKMIKLTTSDNRSYNKDFIQFGFQSCETNEIV